MLRQESDPFLPFAENAKGLPLEFLGLVAEQLEPDKQPLFSSYVPSFDYRFYYTHKNEQKMDARDLPTTPTRDPQLEMDLYLSTFRMTDWSAFDSFEPLRTTKQLIEGYDATGDKSLLPLIYVRVKCHLCFRGPVFSWIDATHLEYVFRKEVKMDQSPVMNPV